MVDNQKKYLDKVVDIIVRETNFDQNRMRIYLPFRVHPLMYPSNSSDAPWLAPYYYYTSYYPDFLKYCKNTYGIVDGEIEYVWDQYRDIIKDRLKTIVMNNLGKKSYPTNYGER
jgi:hypothetical protein